MRIDLMAYLDGLCLPFAYLLGLLSFIWPRLTFSFHEYVYQGDFRKQSDTFRNSFVFGFLTSTGILIYGFLEVYISLHEKHPVLFYIICLVIALIAANTIVQWVRRKKAISEAERLEWERLMATLEIHKKMKDLAEINKESESKTPTGKK